MKKKPRIAVIGLKGLPAFGGALTREELVFAILRWSALPGGPCRATRR